VCEGVGGGEGGWGGGIFWGDPGLCESQEVERLEYMYWIHLVIWKDSFIQSD